MPLYGCKDCHHEFPGGKMEYPRCDWCGGQSHVLAQEASLGDWLAATKPSRRVSVRVKGGLVEGFDIIDEEDI